MPSYDERLHVPVWWWPIAAACIALLGAELYAGLGWVAAVITYAILAALVTVVLLGWRGRVLVADGELHAGSAHLPLDCMGAVETVPPARIRLLRADPDGFVYSRPYLSRAIRIEVRDDDDPTTFWLVFTRDPRGLAAALGATDPVTHS